MYAWICSVVISPVVLQKYPRAHRCCPQYRFFRCENSCCSSRDDRPFRYCTIFAGLNTGGLDTSRCTWSLLTCPVRILISRAMQLCRISSRVRSATSPRRTLYRYFVTHTRWYWMLKTVCEPLRFSAIRFSRGRFLLESVASTDC